MSSFKNKFTSLILAFALAGGGFNALKPDGDEGPEVASSSSGDDDAGDEAAACCVCLTASPDRMYKCNGKFAIKDDADDEKGHALCSGCFGTMMASTKKCPTCRGDMS